MRHSAVLLSAIALAGCGGTAATSDRVDVGPEPSQPLTVTAAPDNGAAVQTANGPVVAGPARPLAVELDEPDVLRVPFNKPPRAGMLFDLDTGEVLWRRNPTRILPIASVTKMMTALVVAERLEPGAKVKVTKEALRTTGSKIGLLPRGKRVGSSALMYGLMLTSGNDAAVALAQRVAGSERAFVDLMNAKATQLNLGCTRFASSSGIVDEGNWSCPYDLAALARAVLDVPQLAKVVAKRQAVLRFPIKGGKLYISSHNPLLRIGYPGALGIKTGYTRAAGSCFVGAASRGGRRLGVVLLRSPDLAQQSKKLLDRGFAAIRAGQA